MTDASREWEPWQPTAADPWGRKWAGHLLRRAAFGGSWADVSAAVAAGPAAAVDRLFRGGPGAAEFDALMDAVAPGDGVVEQPGQPTPDATAVGLEGWWLHRMAASPHPLRERLTLFWHNHFATSVAKVQRPDLMAGQNRLFRTHALGQFGPLVQAVSRDPAMLVWLDSNANVRGKPNENYARELMELFCLGVGHYTEADVREAARAFTGWHTSTAGPAGRRFPGSPPPPDVRFQFNRAAHDDGPKTVLGQTGNWDGGDVVRIVLSNPACPRFLARKLYRGFVSEAEPPSDDLIQPLADRLRATDLDAGDCLRVIFRSRHFHSAAAFRQRVKGPAELVVGLLRTLEAEPPTGAVGLPLPAAAREMGQTLFAPPSVKGWDGGPAWLNTATVLARHNTAWRLLQGGSGPHAVRHSPAALLARHGSGDPAGFLLDLFLQPAAGEIDPQVHAKLSAFLAPGPTDRRLREAAHAVATLPAFQLC